MSKNSNEIITNLITGKINIPTELNSKPITTRKIEISSGAIKHLPTFLKDNFSATETSPLKIAIISDDRTHIAAGAALEALLAKEKTLEVYSVVIPDNIDANISNTELISAYATSCDIIISVGSGTINDLCKYSSFQSGKQYISIPTAPSVNGYTSSTASLEIGGVKKSLQAHLPIAIFMDIDILVSAPERLIISGVGDSLARSTARADWLLSNFIFGTYYSEFIYDILISEEEILFANLDKLLLKNSETIEALCRVLILSGFGMHLAGSSAPASQAEHLIAHYMEMMYNDAIPHTYHGEQIAVTTLAVAKLQHKILSLDEIKISPILHSEKPIFKYFGEQLGQHFLQECSKKQINDSKCEETNIKFSQEWKFLKNRILENYIPPDTIEHYLKTIKGPYTYRHLGWDKEQFQKALHNAPFIRDRFTFLDLAMGLGGLYEVRID